MKTNNNPQGALVKKGLPKLSLAANLAFASLLFLNLDASATVNPHRIPLKSIAYKTTTTFLNDNKLADIITGTVKESTGEPLAGVTVYIKGTKTATQTSADGKFTISAKPGDILVFSYISFDNKEVTVGTERTITVEMTSSSKGLNEVVVTALGVKRSEKSLTYSTQSVSGSSLTDVKSDNLMNSVNGKVAGVTISPSASGVGGSAKVLLRGNRSAAGNNQPLYVIDGVPISNSSNANGQPNSTYGGTPDGGDGISNMNPEDIESLTVLKGASAAALYGSQAANGVIVITTKKGKAGKTIINYSGGYSINKNAYEPEFQNNYGATEAGSTTSWGPKISGADDNLSKFYQTGNNLTNAISLTGGNEIAQSYFSYSNTNARGVEPGNKLNRDNINFHETAKFLNNKLSVDGNMNYITQKINNSPTIGFYTNPLTGLYLFPRGQSIDQYKTNYEGVIGTNGVPTQSWPFQEDLQQNPWWIVNRNINSSKRNRILLNASAKYEFTNWLNIQARGSIDRTSDVYDQRYYAGTLAPLAAGNNNGSYSGSDQVLNQKYGDVIVNLNLPGTTDFKLDGLIGTSINDQFTSGINWGNGLGGYGLSIPNLFTIQNIQVSGPAQGTNTGSNVNTLANFHNQIQAVFANANLSYKDWAYLTVTARNDWSSNLAFTETNHYFYPSAGLSFIVSQMTKLPEVISYAKVRGSYAEVGNTVIQYSPLPTNTGTASGVTLSSVAPYPGLKPEKTKSVELGTDLRFLKDKLNFSFTYYRTNTENQSIKVTPGPATGYSEGYLNAGKIRNTGFEFTLGYTPIETSSFSWNTSINGAKNTNTIIDVASGQGINKVELSNTNSYRSYVATGGSFGDIYGQTLQKDAQGRVLITDQGLPLLSSDFVKIANPAPKFQLGWSNSFTYKKLSLNVLVDGKFGGQVVSVLQSILDSYGVSDVTGAARDAGGVQINGVSPNGTAVNTIDAQKWYTSIGGRNAALGQYVYSATVVRLREASLGYTITTKGPLKAIRLSITGRNLIYFYKKAPYDPEVTSSTSNGLGGVDVFNQPATRMYGANLNVTF
ncbi:SusC/RagA family TonB-linked outer membrane protein [Pedobacter hartonius]|uniref:TonB-linked outer membrane protein, SusC/RagA family n=1 Tax=Pedobacter hartonius TaxID=425514 RepID=A0A1H4FJ06_9SPHI|nr:SusC/RagA family TonB-linked outer membrane protein [Pedobacter hartonius]SEA96472.1 TonB-linked outer membrane protein, SusC/RagA family [Pedobacter hartonius]